MSPCSYSSGRCRIGPCPIDFRAPTRALPSGSVEQDQLSVLLPTLQWRNNRNNGRRGNLRVGSRGSLPNGLRVSGVSVAFVGVSVAFVIGIGRTDAQTERGGDQKHNLHSLIPVQRQGKQMTEL